MAPPRVLTLAAHLGAPPVLHGLPPAEPGPAGPWLAFLAARAEARPWYQLVGRGRPALPVERVDGRSICRCLVTSEARLAVFALGTLRGYAPIVALGNGAEGFVLELGPLVDFQPVTLRTSRPGAGPRFPWVLGAREPTWKDWPVDERRRLDGEDQLGDEVPCPTWATQGLSDVDAARARELCIRVSRPAPLAPPPGPAKHTTKRAAPPPTAGQGSLF